MTNVLIDRREEDIDTGRRSNEDAGKVWSDAATICGIAGAAINREREGKMFPENLQREHGPVGTSTSDFWPPELGVKTFLLF